jgi:WD40 repeat protein/serine/threonine protein kinase
MSDPTPAVGGPTADIKSAVRPPHREPDHIGPYRILESIGEGGMGIVYKAEQREPVRRIVALKVIKLGMDTREVVARFEAERQALAMLSHPNVAKVLDAGMTENGRPYFAMEHVPGIPLTQYCDEHRFTTQQRLELFIPICQAVQHAHQKGIIHRDLKPTNILIMLVDGKPVPKVIDFGIAKATNQALTQHTLFTQTGALIGTPEYMSPEQAQTSGLDVDTRTDIYSLGVILYELLTGTLPLDPKSLREAGLDGMARMIKTAEPQKPSTRLMTLAGAHKPDTTIGQTRNLQTLGRELRGDLDWIVLKAIEKDRSRRYETANGLAMDIQRHLDNEPVLARPPSTAYRFQKAFARNRVAISAAMAVGAALLVGLSVSVWQAVRATHAEHEQRSLRTAAESARVGESSQRQAAEAAQVSERKLRKFAQLEAYAADMKAAQAALQQHSRLQAVALLNRYWPKPGESDLRGIEWRYLWQAARGDEIYTWNHPGMAPGALFSPDGRQMATACFDGMLRIWNVASGKLVGQFDRGVLDEALRVSFAYAPDGATLATAARDGFVLLDSATLRVKRTLQLPEAERDGMSMTALTYSPDGQWLAAGLFRQKTRIWNTNSWESFTLPLGTNGRNAFSADSKTLAMCRIDGGIDLWDLTTRTKAATFSLEASSFAGGNNESWIVARFFPDGNRLVAASGLGNVAMWDVRSGKTIWTERAHASRIYGLALSHDGKRFASGGFDQLIHVWDAATREKVMTLQGHLNEIWSLEFSPDDRYLLTSSKDGTVKMWDAQTKPPPSHWMLDKDEWAVGFTPDGRGLISITVDGATLRHWSGDQVVKSLPCTNAFEKNLTVFSPESQSLYALRPDGEIQVHDVNTLKVKRSFKIPDRCTMLYHVSPDERWIAGRGATLKDLHVWDTASGQAVAHIVELQGNSNSRDLAVFSPDSALLAVATESWQAKLWNIAKREFTPTVVQHPWRVYSMSFSPDGRHLASGSWVGDVSIVEVNTGKPVVAPLYGHGSGIHGNSFSSDGATLISGGDDSTVRFWNVATGREMLVFFNAYNQLARLPFLSSSGQLIVWRDFGQELRLRVQSIPTMAEIEKARAAQSLAR